MNENKPAVPSPFEGLPERKPFSASRREIWIALAMYFAAYLYIDRIFFRSVDGENGVGVWLAVFTLLMVCLTEQKRCTGKSRAPQNRGSGSAALR